LQVEIADYLQSDGITSGRVLEAFRKVPREKFVPEDKRHLAQGDHPLPIGCGQTISQPYIVAYMTEQLQIRRGDRVLEIGTGSGYQAAILGELTRHVYTVETIEALARRARQTLDELGYTWIRSCLGNGYHGWPEHAPYDAIIVTAAASHLPPALTGQLKAGGRLVIPVGPRFSAQNLVLVEKAQNGALSETTLLPVRFVPFTGEREANGHEPPASVPL